MKTASEAVAQQLDGSTWADMAPAIWASVPQDIPYEWNGLGPSAHGRLTELAPGAGALAGLKGLELNLALRAHLAPVLIAAEPEHLAALSRWIVSSWGGIPAKVRKDGVDPVRAWANDLVGFSSAAVAAHISNAGTQMVSSWSKVLAFARPDHDAIYDSRTAVALNIVLCALDDPRRFHIPIGRGAAVSSAAGLLNGDRRALGYREYLALLGSIRSHTGLTLVEIETKLFAVAPTMARRFVSELRRHMRDAAGAACLSRHEMTA